MNQDNPQKKTQRKNPMKEELKESVQERISKYIGQEREVADYLKQNPDAPHRQREMDAKCVAIEVEKLEGILDEVIPYILKIRGYIPNVLEQNKITASYFLSGKIYQSWQALFLLARDGFHYEVMELLRSITESADLMFFFMHGDDASPDLRKWFMGEIVQNEKARKAIHDFMNKKSSKTGVVLPVGEMMSGTYSLLSKYTHVSYGALLDSFDVFGRDFDFERVSGFRYTRKSSLRCAHSTMHHVILVFKDFYQSVGDNDSCEKLNVILRKIAPEMFDREIHGQITQEMIKKFS